MPPMFGSLLVFWLELGLLDVHAPTPARPARPGPRSPRVRAERRVPPLLDLGLMHDSSAHACPAS